MRITYKEVICVIVIAAGVSLAIAGIFVPVLVPCGVALIGLGTGIVQSLAQQNGAQIDAGLLEMAPIANVEASDPQEPDLHVHAEFDFHRHGRALVFSQPPASPQRDAQDEEDAAPQQAIDQQFHNHRPSNISNTR